MDLVLLALGILGVFAIAFVYSNLGMGGGILYVPVLFWLTGYSEDMVVPLSLTLVLANCISALHNHQRSGLVDWKLGFILTTGAIFGSVIGTLFNLSTGKGIFLLIFLGVVIAAIVKMLADWVKKGEKTDVDDDRKLTNNRLVIACIGTIVAGFICGALGLGGGVIIVPILMYILGRGTKNAIGTSFLIMLVATIVGIGTYLIEGVPIDPLYVFSLAPVVLVASYIGSRWGIKRLKGRSVRLLFILVLLIAVVKLGFDIIEFL
jgi:uncharacterized membrane protein YfcA